MNVLKGEVLTLMGKEYGMEDGDYDICEFGCPCGICYDNRNDCLLLTDFDNNNIRKIDGIGNIPKCETIIGNGLVGDENGLSSTVEFCHPSDIICYNRNDELYYLITDTGNNTLLSYSTKTKEVDVLYGNNPSYPLLLNPRCMAINTYDNDECYITTDNGIVIISLINGNYIDTIGKGYRKSEEEGEDDEYSLIDSDFNQSVFNHPDGIIYHNNKLYICDCFNHVIRLIDLETKTVKTLIGCGESGYKNGSFNHSKLYYPRRLCIYSINNNNEINGLLLTEMSDTIRYIDLSSGIINTYCGNGHSGFVDGKANSCEFSTPIGLALIEYQMNLFVVYIYYLYI